LHRFVDRHWASLPAFLTMERGSESSPLVRATGRKRLPLTILEKHEGDESGKEA
jgi:hypothetical protein